MKVIDMTWRDIVKRRLNPDEVEDHPSGGSQLTYECDQCKKKIRVSGGNVHNDGRLICIQCNNKNAKAYTDYRNTMANTGRNKQAIRADQWMKENTQEELP